MGKIVMQNREEEDVSNGESVCEGTGGGQIAKGRDRMCQPGKRIAGE